MAYGQSIETPARSYDAVIVGSGLGGATMALRLAQAGRRVLVVELDGQRYHGSVSAREADRLRDNRLMAAGWRVIRITWEDLRDRPDAIVVQILAALAHAA